MICIKQTDTTAVKVHIEYVDKVFTPRTRCIIKEAVELVSRLLTLRNDPRSTKFHVPRERSACASQYYEGPNAGKCGQLSQSYTGAEWCGGAKIPAAHLKGLQVFGYKDTEPLPESLQEGYGFTDGTNFVLYVTLRESHLCTSSLAHSRVCRRDETVVGGIASGRPVAGVVNACWKEGGKVETADILIRRVIFHELIHLLVMNYRSMREFVECEGRRSRMCWKMQDAVKVVDDKVVVWSRHFRKAIRQQVCEGVGHCQFHSDCCDCSHTGCHFLQDGMPVDNVTRSVDLHGGVVLAKSRTGVHWPPELFANFTSVMVPQYMESGCIILDPLTLALIKTSGWYLVNCSALSCINCFLNSNPYVYSLTSSILENDNSSMNEDTAHPDGEVMNTTKGILSITNVKGSQDTELFTASEEESGDETFHSTRGFDTCTQVAVQTKGHNDSEVSPDLKSYGLMFLCTMFSFMHFADHNLFLLFLFA